MHVQGISSLNYKEKVGAYVECEKQCRWVAVSESLLLDLTTMMVDQFIHEKQ